MIQKIFTSSSANLVQKIVEICFHYFLHQVDAGHGTTDWELLGRCQCEQTSSAALSSQSNGISPLKS